MEDRNEFLHDLDHGVINDKFWKWAASWDCKEAETDGQDSPMIGDEIEVGTLWEDKSQKDFKSYL